MRVVYFGTGEIGLPSLAALHSHPGVELTGVVTQPDRPAGRGGTLRPPPVKQWALAHRVAVQQPASINHPESLSALEAWHPDLVVVCAYGQILKEPVLQCPPLGCINIHASLLPRHRGASCIHAALLAGDPHSGITIIQVEAGLDTGPILDVESVDIAPEETAASLHDRLAELAPLPLSRVIDAAIAGALNPQPQDHALATYAPKLHREFGAIDWSEPGKTICRKVRSLHPWPGSFTFFQDRHRRRRRLKILPPVSVQVDTDIQAPVVFGQIRRLSSGEIAVVCAGGAVQLGMVHPEGSRPMTASDWLRGEPGVFDQILG